MYVVRRWTCRSVTASDKSGNAYRTLSVFTVKTYSSHTMVCTRAYWLQGVCVCVCVCVCPRVHVAKQSLTGAVYCRRVPLG